MNIRLTLLILLVCFAAQAQTVSPENRIVVLGEASIAVPANQIKFNVILESIDSTSVDSVYKKHQVLETNMVKLLKELQVPASNISYSLFSVGKSYDYQTKASAFEGNQSVSFTINAIEQFTEVQSRLIKEGFTQFSSSFHSTKLEQRKAEVLAKAVEAAKEKAGVLAKAANRRIKRIVKVADTEDTDPVFRNYGHTMLEERVVVGYGESNLMAFPQTIPLAASVKVIFELK